MQPIRAAALERDGLKATLEIGGEEKNQFLVTYPPINQGTGNVAPSFCWNLEDGQPANRMASFR